MKIKSKPYIMLLVIAMAFSLVFGTNAGAMTLDKDGNYQIGGYIQNLTGIRLQDGPAVFHASDGTVRPNYEKGDLSMFRNELFVDFSGRISDNVQVKVIGRGHYEGVWGVDSDVNQGPKNEKVQPGPYAIDMESDFDFREYYATFSTGDFVFKVGRMQVAWGEADAVNIADIVCPLDLSYRWSFPTWEDIRIPLHMVNAFYTVPESPYELKFELVYIPTDFRPHMFAYPGSNWALYSNLAAPDFVGEAIFDSMDEGLPDNDMSNAQGGIRIRALLGAWDTYWFAYYGRDQVGVYTLNLDKAAAGSPFPMDFHFPHVLTLGMTFNVYCPWLETVFRGEMAYIFDRPATPIGPDVSPFEYGEFDSYEIMIAFDYNRMIPFLNRTKSFFFSGQYINRFAIDLEEDQYRTFSGYNDAKEWRSIASLLVNTEYYEGKIVPQILVVDFFTERSGFVDFNITYKPTFSLSFQLGILGIWGNSAQAGLFFGPVKDNDEVYAKVKINF